MYNFFSKYKVFPTFVTAFWHIQMKLLRLLSIISPALLLSVFFPSGPVFSQNKQPEQQKQVVQTVHSSDTLEHSADSLVRVYQFGRAKSIYKNLLKMESALSVRTRLESKIVACDNGESLLNYVTEPKVITRSNFSKKDFFLHYPGLSGEGAFVEIPAGLGSKKDTIYFPSNTDILYYSAEDSHGSWNIYMTKKGANNIWSSPKILNSNVTSSGNEVFPYVTPDGKKLYFSSNGHYGAGGYDLYVSNWDEQSGDWGTAQNMGFPYSSPSDDLFFYNTPDGKYSVFASTRNLDNPAKSSYDPSQITVYVLAFETLPVKHKATPEEALNISRLRSGKSQEERDAANTAAINHQLKKVENNVAAAKSDTLTQVATANYSRLNLQLRNLQKSISQSNARQKKNRTLYAALQNRIAENTSDTLLMSRRKDSLATLTQKITEEERNTLDLQENANKTASALKKIEDDFLSNGITVPSIKQIDTSANSALNKATQMTSNDNIFEQNTLGTAPEMKIEKTEAEKDLTFKIGTTCLAKSEDLPDGLIYQVRFLQLAKPAAVKNFKGISPVFETKTAGKYFYTAGIFSSYSAASQALSRIKKLGFHSALIIALNNRQFVSLPEAKKIESKLSIIAYNVIISGYEGSLPEDLLKILKANTQKDIAKMGDNYIVGPFEKQAEANMLAAKLRNISEKNISVEKVK
ncbi:MAG: hypothetical protein WCQ81_04110 [Bacteroidales bacterium]